MMILRSRILLLLNPSLIPPSTLSSKVSLPFCASFQSQISHSTRGSRYQQASASKATANPSISDAARFIRTFLFLTPGVEPDQVVDDMILPGSNIVLGPYAGDSRIKEVEFVKSSARARDCPVDDRPEFAILGRSNVGKSSLINALVRKKEVALTSKKPGKTQLINHFLVNKSWYIVDLPGYGYP